MKSQKFSHKTPHLKGKQHPLDPNVDLKHIVHDTTKHYVDRDNDGDVDIYDNPNKKIPDELPPTSTAITKRMMAKYKGEIKHTKRGLAYEGSLHKWFKSSSSKDGKPGWVNVVTGGTCASDEPGEGTPKCVSSAKRASMTPAERKSAARRKKLADPGQQQKTGAAKPTYISTDSPKKKMNEAKEKDHEYSMARSQLSTVMSAAKRLMKKLGKSEGEIEAWVQSKITKASDYLDAVADYIDSGEHDIKEQQKECPEGQYFCNRQNKCRPIPKGYHLMPDGFLMKDEEMEEMKCWPGYEKKGTQKLFGKKYNRCVKKEEAVSEEDVKGKGSGKKDACYHKVKSRYSVWPSAYASGALVKCRKVGAANWGNKSESVTIEDAAGNKYVEFIDIVKPEPLKASKGVGSELVGEAVRIPAKTGNIILVSLNWRGKYLMIKMFFPQSTKPNRSEVQDQLDKVYPGAKVQSYYISDIKPGEQFLQVEDWQKVNRQDKTDGLSQKAVDAYRRENPGSKLQTAVTEKNPTGKRADRRKNFCRRMKGMKKRLTSTETARDPDSRINKALRRWNCN